MPVSARRKLVSMLHFLAFLLPALIYEKDQCDNRSKRRIKVLGIIILKICCRKQGRSNCHVAEVTRGDEPIAPLLFYKKINFSLSVRPRWEQLRIPSGRADSPCQGEMAEGQRG